MILLIDNYDSFVHNLARYVRRLGHEVRIERNDVLEVSDVKILDPQAIILSPGPCGPAQAGISTDLIRKLGPNIPILGVCLGHQCINEAYGGKTIRAPHPVHGRASQISRDRSQVDSPLFAGLPETFNVGRYHSLACELHPETPLRVTARSEDDVIMAFEHELFPVYGVQFHPESILTEHGSKILENFLEVSR